MSDTELEHDHEYDENGKITKYRFNREKLFREKWDTVLKVRFYSKPHIQRISMAIGRNLGEMGKDWDTYVKGFKRPAEVLEHNQKLLDDPDPDMIESGQLELAEQVLLIGIKDSPGNNVDELNRKIKRLKLRYASSTISKM